MHNYIEYFSLPVSVMVTLMIIFGIMQGIGELLEFKGKVVPEVMKIRKYFKRKKEEKESLREVSIVLKEVKTLLNNVEQHYSTDNIAKRDNWMDWVNAKADVYDTSISELKETLVKLLIDNKRNYLLDFTSKAVDANYPLSKEQYQRFYNVYKEYEEILKENNMTNGQVDVAFDVANKSFEERLKNHAFIEDTHGYGSH